MDDKKKKILIIVAIIVVVGVIAGMICSSIIKQKKHEAYIANKVESMVAVATQAAGDLGIPCEFVSFAERGERKDLYVYVKLDGFGQLAPFEMNEFYHKIMRYMSTYDLYGFDFDDDNIGGALIIEDGSDEFTFTDYSMYKNGEKVASTKDNAYDENGNEIVAKKSGKKKCYWCNGTGSVKYYYGGSDLEAYLDGHDASWYGQCGSCGGTGYED